MGCPAIQHHGVTGRPMYHLSSKRAAANHPNVVISARNGFARKRTGGYRHFSAKSGMSANDRIPPFDLTAIHIENGSNSAWR